MRKIILTILLSILSLNLLQAEEFMVDSKITKVTVYMDRALVEREALIKLSPGENRLIFDFLPQAADGGSLQVKGAQGAVLQDIEYKTMYYSTIPDQKISSLYNRLNEIQDLINDNGDAIKRARDEKEVMSKILASVTTVPEQGSTELDPAKWMKMVDFYSTKTRSLDEAVRNLERSIRELKGEQQKITSELNNLQGSDSKEKNQAVVILQADKAVETRVSLTYMVYGPSWIPDYDIRVNTKDKIMNLFYNARVKQNTGEDWNGVQMILSTAAPHIYGSQPDLSPWNIYLYKESLGGLKNKTTLAELPMAQMFNMYDEAEGAGEGINRERLETAAINTATLAAGATSVRFLIAGSHAIASDNNYHKVAVLSADFPAYFRYSTVPKLNLYAYLKARVTNSTDFPLLGGASKVFLDGDFVAHSSIGNVAPGEEFWTFLGVDDRMEIDYKLIKKEETKGNIFESTDRMIYKYKIVITNKKSVAEEIVVWDQLPISSEKDVKVKLIKPELTKDSSELKKNDQDFLEWLIKLNPGETREIEFQFSVEYPKGRSVAGLF